MAYSTKAKQDAANARYYQANRERLQKEHRDYGRAHKAETAARVRRHRNKWRAA